MRKSLGSHKIRGLVELLQLYRTKTNNAVFASSRPMIANHNASLNVQLAGARFIHHNAAATSGGMGHREDEKPTSSPQLPPPPPRPTRAVSHFPWFRRIKMLLGSVFSLLLAFWAPKWTTLLRIGGEAEVIMEEVELAAEVVEKVATAVEKVSEDVAHILPDNNKIKEAALAVERISEKAAKDAHIAEDIIHKVEKVKQELEDLGETVETVVHDGNGKSYGAANSNL